MKPSLFSVAVIAASLTAAAHAADPSTPEEAKKKEDIRNLILADASKAPASPAKTPEAKTATKSETEAAVTPPAAENKPAAAGTATQPDETTMLPQVEVNKSRITNIDLAIQEQDKAIAREKQNVKPTKLDDTLNNSKVAKALAIFGGSSSEGRSAIAQERIRIMEEEKELLESLRLARTKEEKEELQTELDALRAERRELDRAPK